MLVELTKSHFGSLSENIPEVKLHNLYIVQNPLSITGFSYISRPTLLGFSTPSPDNNVRGVYHQQGFFDDGLIVVSGESVYSVNDAGAATFVGSVQGLGLCKFASTIYGIAIISGDFFYIYDETGIHLIEIPDSEIPSDVTSLNNYFIFSIRGSNKFFWILPGEITVDPLSFASAESNPDFIVSVQATSDELWIMGTRTTEVWTPTADVDAPFVRISGRVFNYGTLTEDSVVSGVFNSLPCLLWVTDTKEVILAQGSTNKISNEYVEEMLRASSYFYGWFLRRQRNDFYILSTDVITLVYDLTTDSWYKWSSAGQGNWKVSAGVRKGDNIFSVGLGTSPSIYKLVDGSKDEGQDWLVCEVSGFVQHANRRPMPCTTIQVVSSPGFSSQYGQEPTVEMRWSDDQGANWSSYVPASMGNRGSTGLEIYFRSLGLIKTPGRRFEFRFSLSEVFRMDYVILNNEA